LNDIVFWQTLQQGMIRDFSTMIISAQMSQ